MKEKEDEWVKCPYYLHETKQAVFCEGVADGVGLRMGFKEKPAMDAYKECFCRDAWQGCMIAKMLNRKYDYEP